MNEKDYSMAMAIADVLNPEKVKETCPVLLVGKAVPLFKKMYKDPIRELKSADDVKEFVSEYTGISSSKPVVISDIGYLHKTTAFLLLKLVEEAKFPAILLSSDDKVDSILLSRVKRVVKFPKDEETGNKFIPIRDAYNQVYGESDKKVIDKTKFYAENCPDLYKLEENVPYNEYRNMMIEVLGRYLWYIMCQ